MRLKNTKIYNIATNDYKGSIKINGKDIKSYTIWKSMLKRCYDEKYQEKYRTYIGCKVCDEWLSFSNFKKWFDENYRWDLEEIGIKLALDKDLLSEGNKIYSPKTCLFLPIKVNSFLSNKKNTNTSGYIGVCWSKQKKKWVAYITDFNTNKQRNLGSFDNIIDAKNIYIVNRKNESEKAKLYLTFLGYDKYILKYIK